MSTFDRIAGELCALAREAHARGSVAATSGNFSAVVSREPLRVAITPSGADKGALTPDRILEIDGDGKVLKGSGRPSAETAVHLALMKLRGAGAVAHTHSVWATLLSGGETTEGSGGRIGPGDLAEGDSTDSRRRISGGAGGSAAARIGGLEGRVEERARGSNQPTGTGPGSEVVSRGHSAGGATVVAADVPASQPMSTRDGPPQSEVVIQGYEMLKALSGVTTHEHREVLPVVENTQDWSAGVREIEKALERAPGAHGFLIRGHGLYTWGADVAEAGRHLAALEFLLEVHGRRTWRS